MVLGSLANRTSPAEADDVPVVLLHDWTPANDERRGMAQPRH
jgi:hypothetical protein